MYDAPNKGLVDYVREKEDFVNHCDFVFRRGSGPNWESASKVSYLALVLIVLGPYYMGICWSYPGLGHSNESSPGPFEPVLDLVSALHSDPLVVAISCRYYNVIGPVSDH